MTSAAAPLATCAIQLPWRMYASSRAHVRSACSTHSWLWIEKAETGSAPARVASGTGEQMSGERGLATSRTCSGCSGFGPSYDRSALFPDYERTAVGTSGLAPG